MSIIQPPPYRPDLYALPRHDPITTSIVQPPPYRPDLYAQSPTGPSTPPRYGHAQEGCSYDACIVNKMNRKGIRLNTCSNGSECAVCLNDDITHTTGGSLACGHTFHTSCIEKWFQSKFSCPNCRRRVDVLNLIWL